MFPSDFFLLEDKKYIWDEDIYRVNHDTISWRDNLPEVFPFLDNHFTNFGKEYQLLERQLNAHLSNSDWRDAHTWQRAYNNQNGYDRPGDPRADWVNNRDTTRDPPKQEALVSGGAFLKRRFADSDFLYPAYIDGTRPAPSLDWVLRRPYLYFEAVNIDWTPDGAVLRRFLNGKKVFFLLLASRPIRISLSKVTRMKRGQMIPSPYNYP